MHMLPGAARRAGVVLALTGLALAACGQTTVPPSSGATRAPSPPADAPRAVLSEPPTAAPTVPEDTAAQQPPPLVITSDTGTSEHTAYTYCWSAGGVGVCADGVPVLRDRVRIAGTTQLAFPVDGWTLRASRWLDRDGTDTAHVTLRRVEDTVWIIADPPPSGRHVLEVSGRGPEGTAFWAVPVEVEAATDHGDR
jgi:hypothetical protein